MSFLQKSKDRSGHRRCLLKNLFLEILQNSQENTCTKVSFLIKLQVSALKEGIWKVKNTFFSGEILAKQKVTHETEIMTLNINLELTLTPV